MIVQEVFDLWGGQAEVTTEAHVVETALRITKATVDDVDLECSTFRDDSQISRVNRGAGHWIDVDPLFLEILRASLEMAALTEGALDPTVGHVTQGNVHLHRANWRMVELTADAVRLPAHLQLDLGATAKAWCADTAARRAAEATGAGVLVGLCGDIAVSGPTPEGGWDIVCGDDHRSDQPDHADAPGGCVAIRDGGVATSSTTVRRHKGRSHILDPGTMRPVEGPWRTATVAARSCLHANAASTAALVQGSSAVRWLERMRLPARLVAMDATVTTIGGWPR